MKTLVKNTLFGRLSPKISGQAHKFARALLLANLFLLLAPLPGWAGTTALFEQPTGIYVLSDRAITSGKSDALNKPFVDGLVVRLHWKDLEKEKNVYDFSEIDTAIAKVENAGKKLTLVIFALEAPAYVKNTAGVKTYSAFLNGRNVVAPLPWDSTALSRWDAFCEALSSHLVADQSQSGSPLVPLKDHPVLAQVDAPIVGLQSVRDLKSRLVSVKGYDRATFISATLSSLHSMVDRFPNVFHYLGFFRMSDSNTTLPLDDELLNTVMTEFNSGVPTLGLFEENLSCSKPSTTWAYPLRDMQDRTYTMFQMLQAWMDPGFDAASTNECLVTTVPGDINTAISGPEVAISYAFNNYGTRYFEIYRADIDHEDFSDEFTLWHTLLWQ